MKPEDFIDLQFTELFDMGDDFADWDSELRYQRLLSEYLDGKALEEKEERP